jgi:hypothetical protein
MSPKRLEGLVVQKRGAIEKPRYLVMDFNNGSISLYKKPPPKIDSMSSSAGSQSVTAKLARSLQWSISDSQAIDAGERLISCKHLAHLTSGRRDRTANWSPKFTVPFSVDWKIRDVENDEFMFYLVLPSDYKAKDTNAEVVSISKIGKNVSYRNLDVKNIDTDSGNEDDARAKGGESATHAKSNNFKQSLFMKSFAKDKPLKQEKILTFRVLLDGNEKFLWLAGAKEMKRLADASAIFVLGSTFTVTR